jgi:hypothetical protein
MPDLMVRAGTPPMEQVFTPARAKQLEARLWITLFQLQSRHPYAAN